MLRPLLLLAATLVPCACVHTPPPRSTSGAAAALPDDDALVRAMLASEEPRIAAYFGSPLPRPYELRLFRHRADMEAFARATWQMPELPCWAVAMGSGSRLAVLCPSAWTSEACEHDPNDQDAMRLLLAHELVHVYHGQHRADTEFMQADEVGWLVEGLAVLASGQLTPARLRQAAAAVAAGHGPTTLADAWSGNARYGIAGSMVRFVEDRLGQARIVDLLDDSTNAAILARVGMDEEGFLTAWRRCLARDAGAASDASVLPSPPASSAR